MMRKRDLFWDSFSMVYIKIQRKYNIANISKYSMKK